MMMFFYNETIWRIKYTLKYLPHPYWKYVFFALDWLLYEFEQVKNK